ncbi:unnamed protein product, partial [Owenia fusiformis]
GGLMDDTDRDHIHTALRETEEELGLSPDNVDIWGQLIMVPGKDYKILVAPVIGVCGEIDVNQLRHNEDEVEEVFTRTIKSLSDPANQLTIKYPKGFSLPEYLGGPHRIWGLTAIVLHQTLSLIAPGIYSNSFKIPV